MIIIIIKTSCRNPIPNRFGQGVLLLSEVLDNRWWWRLAFRPPRSCLPSAESWSPKLENANKTKPKLETERAAIAIGTSTWLLIFRWVVEMRAGGLAALGRAIGHGN